MSVSEWMLIHMLRSKLIALPRLKKRLLTLALDVVIIWAALFTAFAIRLDAAQLVQYQTLLINMMWLTPVIVLPITICLGLYRAVMRYMNSQLALTLLQVGGLSITGIILATYLLDWNLPRSLAILFGLVLMTYLGVSRYAARYWLLGSTVRDILMTPFHTKNAGAYHHRGKPVAVYGAGDAGCQLVSALDRGWEYRPVLFIDDNPSLMEGQVYGRKVYPSAQLKQLVAQQIVDQVLLAMPSVGESRRRAIIKSLEPLNIPVLTMPGMSDLASGRLTVQDIKAVEVDDLLGRAQVAPNAQLLDRCIRHATVMVTGAGGSIGSELCRQIITLECQRLILFDHSEFNLYQISQDLQRIKSTLDLSLEIIAVLGSVNDPKRLLDVMSQYNVNTVYHAAAYKHVPMVEHNISQGIRNNVLGTLYTAQAAIVCNVTNFVLISTDKAVRPTNIMGATKRLAELVLQALGQLPLVELFDARLFNNTIVSENNTRFTMVRFGNVLGSSGSVIPKFREQIQAGGPITVTHPDIVRFFMTIPEAAQLVIQAGSMGAGGDVFLLDMGEPVKIVDLAKQMINLSGFSEKTAEQPNGDIAIEFVGLRPGEKLYEELLISDNAKTTAHPLIFKATETSIPWAELKQGIMQMTQVIDQHDYLAVRELLQQFVSGFTPDSVVVDWFGKTQLTEKAQ